MLPEGGLVTVKVLILGNQGRSSANFWTVLARRILLDGHDVVFAVPPGDAQADAALRSIGDARKATGAPRVVHYPLDRKGLNPLHDVRSFAALVRLMRAERPDYLFATTIKPVIYGCLAARVARVPHVYATITGLGYAFEADSFFKRCINKLSVFLYARALARVEGVFFQNQDDVALFRQCGILAADARVLMARGTGVDVKRFAPLPLPPLPADDALPGEKRLVFLLVGRLLEAKGLEEYAEAARLLRERYPAAVFRLLGPAETGRGGVPLETISRWQEQGLVEYLGETRDVRPHVAEAHVLVLPSWREGTPNSVMEGMSMGRPAVVTDAPGCREVVRDGDNGLLCRVRDPRSLADALEHFLKRPSEVVRMGAAGRRLALAEFDADVVASGIVRDMGLKPRR